MKQKDSQPEKRDLLLEVEQEWQNRYADYVYGALHKLGLNEKREHFRDLIDSLRLSTLYSGLVCNDLGDIIAEMEIELKDLSDTFTGSAEDIAIFSSIYEGLGNLYLLLKPSKQTDEFVKIYHQNAVKFANHFVESANNEPRTYATLLHGVARRKQRIGYFLSQTDQVRAILNNAMEDFSKKYPIGSLLLSSVQNTESKDDTPVN